MTNIQLDMSRGMDKADAAVERGEKDVMVARQQETLRKSGLVTNGPSTEQYDYAAAEISEDPEGGYNMPNIGQKHVYPAGRNLQTGEVVQKRNDPDGLGAEGAKRYGESYYNTERGEPAKIFEATVPLYMEHLQNGGTMEDFPLPVSDEVKQRTQEAVESLAKLDATQANLAKTEYQEVPLPVSESESITREAYAANPAVITATKILSEYIAPGLFSGEPGDEAAMIEKSIEELSAVKASFWKMADIIIDVESGNMPDEVRDAYITLLTEHAKIPDMDADVWQGVATGLLADTPLMLATGGVSSLALKTVGKQAAVRTLLGKLMQSTTGKLTQAAIVSGSAGGAEGGAAGASESLMMQGLEDGPGDKNWERVFDSMWTGTKWGAALGVPFGPLLSQPGRDGIRYMMRNASDMMADAGVRTDMAAQSGSVGVPKPDPSYNGLTVPEARSDLGVRFADPSMDEFYSRLQDTLIGENPMMGKKPQPAAQLLKTLEGARAKGQKFSGYELQEAGVIKWLESQGDGNVSRDMMEDYLYANSPRTNILVSSMTDWEGPGSASYKGAANAPDMLRRTAALDVFQDRFFDEEIILQPVDMTLAIASSKRFGVDVDYRMAALDKAEDLDASGLSLPEDLPLMSTKPQLAARDYPNAEGHTQALWQWADRKAKARVAGEPFSEAVPMPEPRSEEIVKLTDLRDGSTTLTKDPHSHTSAAAREATANMTDDAIIEMIDLHDKTKLLAPPKYGKFTITGEASNSYQEIRITLPYDGVTNPDTIAMERFGSSYADLTHGNKTRVDRTMEYARAPEVNFRSALHMPLEHNRLSTVRTQEFYTPDQERVLAVNELQSDMAVAMRKNDGKPDMELALTEDLTDPMWLDAGESAPDIPKPSLQPTKGWMEQSVNRIFQVADEQGYKQVAFPVDPAMIKQIQGWTDEMAGMGNAKSTVRFYETLAKYLKKDKTLAKTWGISSIELGHVGAAPGGEFASEKMLIIKFNASKNKGAKPIYGIAAISGAEGATMVSDSESED